MAVLIRDADVERLIRELADRTAESITDAVRVSILERLQRIAPNEAEIARRKRRVREITSYFDGLPQAETGAPSPVEVPR